MRTQKPKTNFQACQIAWKNSKNIYIDPVKAKRVYRFFLKKIFSQKLTNS